MSSGSSTVRRSTRLSRNAGFSVTPIGTPKKEKPDVVDVPKPRDELDPTIQFLYRPRSILVLCSLILGLVYAAFFHTSPSDAFGNAFKYIPYNYISEHYFRGVLAAALSFIFIGVVQFGDGPFIRPHPIIWRLVLSVSILYLLALIVLLFQTVDVARHWVSWLDASLGVPLDEKSYAEDCSLTWANLMEKMDMFVLAHLFGWAAKAIIIRDEWLCWIISIMFEVMEYSLEFQMPNFGECWWDHWVLDVFTCNWFGIILGMRICKWLSMKTYNWRSIKVIPDISGKVVRTVEQLTPHSWTSFDWATTKTFKGYMVSLFIVVFFLASELNAFYLKALLWIPPPHWINFSRVVLHGLMGMVALRELYQYFTDPACQKLGTQLWVALAIIIIESLVCFKFGRGNLPTNVPSAVVKFWIVFTTILVLFPIYRFWYRRRN